MCSSNDPSHAHASKPKQMHWAHEKFFYKDMKVRGQLVEKKGFGRRRTGVGMGCDQCTLYVFMNS